MSNVKAILDAAAEERKKIIKEYVSFIKKNKTNKEISLTGYAKALMANMKVFEENGCLFEYEGDMTAFCADMIRNGAKVSTYAKFARIKAVQGKVGQVVETIMANGVVETVNTVKLDETTKQPGWIVTNPNGERYIISDSTFNKKYEPDEQPGVYKPKGGVVKFFEIDRDISFVAPWGSVMNIEKGGYICVQNLNDIYGIQKAEFLNTYKQCDADGNFIDGSDTIEA